MRVGEVIAAVDQERELAALNVVVKALLPLDKAQQQRVLRYVIDYFQIGGLER